MNRGCARLVEGLKVLGHCSEPVFQSVIPSEDETRRYFSAAQLSLDKFPDPTLESGFRWGVSKSDGSILWLQGQATATSLEALWTAWWRRYERCEWLRRCATEFGGRYARSTMDERANVDNWIAQLGFARCSDEHFQWPWLSASAPYEGGALRLYGWPWDCPPTGDDPMPPPRMWMARARAFGVANGRDPAAFMHELVRAISCSML